MVLAEEIYFNHFKKTNQHYFGFIATSDKYSQG
jgi:hypothetical protein